jgi:hypothetical protein
MPAIVRASSLMQVRVWPTMASLVIFRNHFNEDLERYIAEEVLPIASRLLTTYPFNDPLTLPAGKGIRYTALRPSIGPLQLA